MLISNFEHIKKNFFDEMNDRRYLFGRGNNFFLTSNFLSRLSKVKNSETAQNKANKTEWSSQRPPASIGVKLGKSLGKVGYCLSW